jgi:hypothetical protein
LNWIPRSSRGMTYSLHSAVCESKLVILRLDKESKNLLSRGRSHSH